MDCHFFSSCQMGQAFQRCDGRAQLHTHLEEKVQCGPEGEDLMDGLQIAVGEVCGHLKREMKTTTVRIVRQDNL